MAGLGLIAILLVLIVGGFYYWGRRHGLSTEDAAAAAPGERRISLLTEAVAYVGAILLLAGGLTAINQRWDDIGTWGQVGILTAGAALFLLIGILVRGVREPAIQRLVGVVWFLSVIGVGWAVLVAALDENENVTTSTFLTVGLAVTAYSAILWLLRRRVLQNVAVFAGLVTTICGAIVAIADPASGVPYALALWGFGLVWAALGWRRYVDPVWVTLLTGVILALVSPSLGLGEQGWFYAIAIGTAAGVMALSVPLRSTPLLALGTLATFGYVTAAVVEYFGESLGVPAALSVTGILIIGLAVISARLRRLTRPKKPTQGPSEPRLPATHPTPDAATLPAGLEAPGPARASPRDLSKTS
jgi:hypothetical protein